MPSQLTTAERFWAKVDTSAGPDACWLWTSHTRNGYGQFKLDRRQTPAHRWAYEAMIGPIPKGLQLDHLCRVRNCVNPKHLEPVTHQENIRRGMAGAHWAAKTHCPQGHPYSGENLYVTPGEKRRRMCRECMRNRTATARAMRTDRRATLSPDQVREIRIRAAAGERNKDLAIVYGVDRTSISKIIHHKQWAGVV